MPKKNLRGLGQSAPITTNSVADTSFSRTQPSFNLVRPTVMDELTDAQIDNLFRSLVDKNTSWCLLEDWYSVKIQLDVYYAKLCEEEE